MCDYEDFYEPSEFELLVEDFKDELRKSVKKEWIDKMNRLEAENKELQEVKKNFNQIKSDYEKAKWECKRESEKAIANAKGDAYSARLSELLDDMKAEYWSIKKEFVKKPKCDKCDANRMVAYITPLGKQAKEQCTCDETESKYVPCERVIYQIGLYNSRIESWFVRKRKEDEDTFVSEPEYYRHMFVVKDEEDISSLVEKNEYSLYFESFEKCQEYCDYLNLREQK